MTQNFIKQPNNGPLSALTGLGVLSSEQPAGVQPAPAAPSGESVEALAHRMAWRYKKSTDPHHSDTYTFNRATLLDFAAMLLSADRAAQWLVEVRDQFRGIAEQANQALTRHVADLAQPADSARQKSIREDFELIADAHMQVFGMAHSPAREQAWDALKTALERNMNRG